MGKGVFDRKNEFTQFFMQTVPVLCHAETGMFTPLNVLVFLFNWGGAFQVSLCVLRVSV
jgi:hypothetical protein